MARIEKEVKLVYETDYTRNSFSGYGYETVHVYKMVAGDTVYVWKTTGFLKKDTVVGDEVDTYFPKVGDVLKIRATVKGEIEYKGKSQTEINRVNVVEVILRYKDVKRSEQLESITGLDFIWYQMPYKQYKAHYSDCETVIDSYTVHEDRPPTIDVIIREGRLKNSGVRGQHYLLVLLENERGQLQSYQAMSVENALNRAEKELGGSWVVKNVQQYRKGLYY